MDHHHPSMDPNMPMDGGHDMPMSMCSMNMLWNHDVKDVCVVFESWHIRGPGTMALSCLAIAVISIFYASLLHYIKSYDLRVAYALYNDSKSSNPAARRESLAPAMSGADARRQSLIPPNPNGYGVIETGTGRIGITKLSLQTRVIRAGLYAAAVALSFWLMLVAMTYNTYLFASIVVGAFLGHVLYEAELDVGSLIGPSASKGLACH